MRLAIIIILTGCLWAPPAQGVSPVAWRPPAAAFGPKAPAQDQARPPSGADVESREQAFGPQAQWVELTPELLKRWRFPSGNISHWKPEAVQQLRQALTLAENRRLESIRRLEDIVGEGALASYLTPEGFPNSRGLKLLKKGGMDRDEWGSVTSLRRFGWELWKSMNEKKIADSGRQLHELFDGTPFDEKNGVSLPYPDWNIDYKVQAGQLKKVRVEKKSGAFGIEAGTLGLDNRAPDMLRPSPYVGVTRRYDNPARSRRFDYRSRYQAAGVYLEANTFGEYVGLSDDEISSISREISDATGILPEDSKKIMDYTRYDDPYKKEWLPVMSALWQMGRAYPLPGPFSFGWTSTQLLNMASIFPNFGFDQTVGLRYRIKEPGAHLGLFAGLTENVGGNANGQLLGIFTPDRRPNSFIDVQKSPHVAMSYWTQMPNMHDVHFGASLAHQWNRDTTEDTGRAGFMTLYGGRPFSMSAFYSQAKGPAIEYRRDRVGAEVRYQARHNMEAAVAVTHDQIDYGNAEVRNYAVRGMLNFRWDLNNSGRSGMRASVLAAKDGKDVLGDRNMDLTDRVRDLSDTLQNAAVVTAVAMSDLLGVLAQSGGINQDQVIQNVGAIVEVLSGVDQQILEQTAQTLSENGLNEAQKQTLIDLAGDVVSGEATTEDVNQGLLKIIDQSTDPDSPEVLPPLGAEPGSQDSENINSDENVAKIQEMHAKINMVLDILAKHNNALERAALSYGRQQALAAMRDVDIPIPGLGIHLRLTPATLLAAGHVLAKPPSPTAPLTLRNQKEVMEPWILSQAMGPLGIEGEPSYDQVVGKLYGMIEDRLREQLKTHVAGALAEFIQTQSPETGAAVIDSLVQSLSPELQAEVRQDVADPVKAVLLDPELSAAMKSGKIIDIVIEKAITALKETDNGAFQRNLEQLVAALADMMRHEINRALIHLILASEALDEVTVNRGLPPADLSRQMLMNSFNKLDERHRGRVNDKLKALARKMDAESLENSRRLEAGLVAAARERIESLQRQESWPQNFSIQVAESSWPGLIAVYGEEGTAGLFRNLRDEFRKQPKLARLAVVLEFDPKSAGTSIVPRPRQGELLIVLRGLEPTPLETPERRLERIDKFVSNLPKGAVRSMIAD